MKVKFGCMRFNPSTLDSEKCTCGVPCVCHYMVAVCAMYRMSSAGRASECNFACTYVREDIHMNMQSHEEYEKHVNTHITCLQTLTHMFVSTKL